MSRSACNSCSLVKSRVDGLFEPLPLSCCLSWPLSLAVFFFGAAMGNSVLKRSSLSTPTHFALKGLRCGRALGCRGAAKVGAPDAAQRVALAERCAAEPGPPRDR